jgi:hypothetical protein
VIAALAVLAGEKGSSGPRGELDPRIYGELRGVLNHYWTHLLGRPPRMQRWLPTPAR